MSSNYDFLAVDKAMKVLMFEVTNAVALCGGTFWNGAYTGGNIPKLFDMLRVDMEEVSVLYAPNEKGSLNKLAAWNFDPFLVHDESRNIFHLKVPIDRLQSHRDYKLVGYLIRALANYRLNELVSDTIQRRRIAWEFCDQVRWRYKNNWENPSTNREISAQFAHLGSPEDLHNQGIPLSQVTAFMARSRPDIFSFAVYYTANIQEFLDDRETECVMHVNRTLGSTAPEIKIMIDCHRSGLHDLMSSNPVHSQVSAPGGLQHIIVTDTPFRLNNYDNSSNFDQSFLEINRTVLFSMHKPFGPPSWH